MKIKNLENTSLDVIVECMNQCFQNYFVKIPSDVEFWAKRYAAARADFKLSFGVFDKDVLVAFIIQGVDIHNNHKTAFNTGTGVLESYRGQKLVDKIYDFAFPVLKEYGITKCMLEVIDENHRAVRVYERIGFQKDRFLRCFNGELDELENKSSIQEIDISAIKESILPFQKYYSWDNSIDAILKGGKLFKTYLVRNQLEIKLGYFIMNTLNSSLIQIEVFDEGYLEELIAAINTITPTLKINNVDDSRTDLLNALTKSGLQNHINQFEMTLFL